MTRRRRTMAFPQRRSGAPGQARGPPAHRRKAGWKHTQPGLATAAGSPRRRRRAVGGQARAEEGCSPVEQRHPPEPAIVAFVVVEPAQCAGEHTGRGWTAICGSRRTLAVGSSSKTRRSAGRRILTCEHGNADKPPRHAISRPYQRVVACRTVSGEGSPSALCTMSPWGHRGVPVAHTALWTGDEDGEDDEDPAMAFGISRRKIVARRSRAGCLAQPLQPHPVYLEAPASHPRPSQPARVDPTGYKDIRRGLVCACVRQQVHDASFQVRPVPHTTHWWLRLHDSPQMGVLFNDAGRHVRHDVAVENGVSPVNQPGWSRRRLTPARCCSRGCQPAPAQLPEPSTVRPPRLYWHSNRWWSGLCWTRRRQQTQPAQSSPFET